MINLHGNNTRMSVRNITSSHHTVKFHLYKEQSVSDEHSV